MADVTLTAAFSTIPGEDAEAIKRLITEIVAQLAREDGGFSRAKLVFTGALPVDDIRASADPPAGDEAGPERATDRPRGEAAAASFPGVYTGAKSSESRTSNVDPRIDPSTIAATISSDAVVQSDRSASATSTRAEGDASACSGASNTIRTARAADRVIRVRQGEPRGVPARG